MPHITIDYSPWLADGFDRRAFVRELHPAVLEGTGSTGVCKTFFRPAAETYVGDLDDVDGGGPAFVHVEVGLLPGRPDGLKARLSEEILALLGRHLPRGDADRVVSSVEVRDLTDTYRLRHPDA
ncbi:5-carboxymethyl-2-hydroxymuconate Delta-isomerase [Kitasatospora sp. HPMI-4]|uniref:5-carboxymethyl-2-hydroxymuconate Delta-isomerase n=1 Tax=Kitasatospora sp. HPMI-4 TaxID=3448443 RepID=UPI003F1DBBD4